MEEQKPKHKRRVRYSGTHPKTFQEKYKEHDPEKYNETIEKVISKGSTPAGMHLPICVEEILEFLDIQPGEIGLDATLGYGGHSLRILEKLNGTGHLHALDVDPIELPKTTERLAKQGYGAELLTTKPINFSKIDEVVAETGPFDFILADLGVSSMQIDNPKRGFSHKKEGPLDLRMNPESGVSATDLLAAMNYHELEGVLIENSDEPHASLIAKAVMAARKKGTVIETTTQLSEIITEALRSSKVRQSEIKKSCQRTFQALRIEVNKEFDALDEFLSKLPDALKSGGRVAILTFHSGEDRRVKKSFQHFLREGIFREVVRKPILASEEECRRNSRARPAKLRWAIKA